MEDGDLCGDGGIAKLMDPSPSPWCGQQCMRMLRNATMVPSLESYKHAKHEQAGREHSHIEQEEDVTFPQNACRRKEP